MRKLNLGCGFDKREGFVNADHFAACDPDIQLDIEQTPWQLQDNSFDYILMKHVLEHVGADFATWWSDPTHVRAFTPLTFRMMSKKQNDEWIAKHANYTMLAHVMQVDFEIVEALQVYDPQWWQKVQAGELTKDQLRAMADQQWGVVKELQVKLRAVKG